MILESVEVMLNARVLLHDVSEGLADGLREIPDWTARQQRLKLVVKRLAMAHGHLPDRVEVHVQNAAMAHIHGHDLEHILVEAQLAMRNPYFPVRGHVSGG